VAGLPDPGTLVHLVGRTERTFPRPAPAASPPAEALSDRERDVLRLLNSSLSLREIGRTLYVSPNTVKTHVRGIYAKLGVSSREQAVTRARELGLA
jgi:LuxR family maltose regulon positive regulatory protein